MDFQFDVFLSHSAKDKLVVCELAARLKRDGLRVWLDEDQLKPGDSVLAKIEEGLERSRVLVLCMSANAFGSDWVQLEAGTFRFRDPLNQERRFIPLRLDDAPIKGSLAQFLYVNWLPDNRKQEYGKLYEACRPPARQFTSDADVSKNTLEESTVQQVSRDCVWSYAFSRDHQRVFVGGAGRVLKLLDGKTGHIQREFTGHLDDIWSVAWSEDERFALSGSNDNTAKLWDVEKAQCVRSFNGHTRCVNNLIWCDDSNALSCSDDRTARLWNIETGDCCRTFEGHSGEVQCVGYSKPFELVITGSADKTIRIWDIQSGKCLRVLEGHTDRVFCLAFNSDQRQVLSGSGDGNLRLWDIESGRCLRVFSGHTREVKSIAWRADNRLIISGSVDKTIRVWDAETGRCVCTLNGHTIGVRHIAWTADQCGVIAGYNEGDIRTWDLSKFVPALRGKKVTIASSADAPDQVQYTNAKVLLVGESGVGKTGLSKRLALNDWQLSDSTVGAWATQWKLPVSSSDGVEREIWLWDFGGQADQRLIHQLYMDETALAILVFDGQKEDVFETLGQWDRDLSNSARKSFAKLLVAGRVDAGGLRVSRSDVLTFVKEHKFVRFLETSAKTNKGCDELKQAVINGIDWSEIPCRTTEVLFKRLKEEVIRLKDEGRVLMRFKELRETLQLRLSDEIKRFTDEELRAVLSLLAGPGIVWELQFGSWVLLQPERINSYAQAVIRTLQADEHQRGCLMEESVLNGSLTYESSMARLDRDEERFVLLAMHQTLVERGLCLREHTDKGTMLIFPSYYRRERPDLVGHPAALVSYRFNGFLDDIYATLVVRLHHTKPFTQDRLWRYAADFKTLTGKLLGVKLERQAAGTGELIVYADPKIPDEEKIIFSRYVHEHIVQKAADVVRLRHYVCPHCGTPVGNREIAMKRLDTWLEKHPAETALGAVLIGAKAKPDAPTIICSECEKRVPLWDDLEKHFANEDTKQRVRELEEQAAIVLSDQSKERVLVGEVISTAALADQICRELNVSDQGIDMEIEFTNDAHEATGAKLYLQLKSGDSYLRERKRDGAEIFTIKDQRHASYWMAQAFPVMLVIRNSDDEVRWMEVRDWLKHVSDNGKKSVKHIIFQGERFDVMSLRRWREKILNSKIQSQFSEETLFEVEQ